jgi:hypothetical protein
MKEIILIIFLLFINYIINKPTESFWINQIPYDDRYYNSPTFPSKSDYLIIGAGYSGISTAYFLSNNTNETITILGIILT